MERARRAKAQRQLEAKKVAKILCGIAATAAANKVIEKKQRVAAEQLKAVSHKDLITKIFVDNDLMPNGCDGDGRIYSNGQSSLSNKQSHALVGLLLHIHNAIMVAVPYCWIFGLVSMRIDTNAWGARIYTFFFNRKEDESRFLKMLHSILGEKVVSLLGHYNSILEFSTIERKNICSVDIFDFSKPVPMCYWCEHPCFGHEENGGCCYLAGCTCNMCEECSTD